MKILIHGLNYAPEAVGVGKYTTEMAEWLAARGHDVNVVAAPPYYPNWHVPDAYKDGKQALAVINGVKVRRTPIFVPANPTTRARAAHHISWAVQSAPTVLRLVNATRPDLAIAIAPSLLGLPVTRHAAKRCGAASWVHVQDFEADAAAGSGYLKQSMVTSGLKAFEKHAFSAFDGASSICPAMVQKLNDKRKDGESTYEFRNWTDTDAIRPQPRRENPYRAEWGFSEDDIVCLYSGTIARKQGLDVVVKAARRLEWNKRVHVVICGEGAYKEDITKLAALSRNIRFLDFQPADRMAALLTAADIHLMPQLAGAADTMLPSKLAAMLASGRPVAATAAPDTDLGREVDGTGLLSPPGDADALAEILRTLAGDPALRERLGAEGRQRALARWDKHAILSAFEAHLCAFVEKRQAAYREDLSGDYVTAQAPDASPMASELESCPVPARKAARDV